MPELSETTKLAKVMQALEALQLITRGVDKIDACLEAGISVWQFDRWISEGGPVIEEFQHNVVEAERIRLVNVTNAQAILLQQLIEAVTYRVVKKTVLDEHGIAKEIIIPVSVDTSDQLKVLKYLDGLRKELETRHGVHSETDSAQEYLSGPNTHIETSKMLEEHEFSRSSVKVSQGEDGAVDVNVSFKKLIEDVTPKDPTTE